MTAEEPQGPVHEPAGPEPPPDDDPVEYGHPDPAADDRPAGHGIARSIRRAIEFCGEHPFATGLFAVLGMVGLGLAMIDFAISRNEAQATTEQVERVEEALGELGERVGTEYRGGVFLFEEPIEGLYFNEWWAHPLRTREEIERFGQAEVTIRGEGKTVDFSGVLSMNCSNGQSFWRSPQNFVTQISEQEADSLIPEAVQRNVHRLFCRSR